MIYKMTLTDSSDTMTFNLLETPIVDKDIEGAVDNVTLDGNQYTDYLYLKKQYIQKWAIMCPDEYDELRGFYTRQFEEGEVPLYRVYYGANVTKDYIYNGDYFQFNAKGLETGMYLSQLTGNAEQDGTPTPDAPVPISTVTGENTVKVEGKNLFDKSTATLGKFVNASGNEQTSSDVFATYYISIKPNTDYYISGRTAWKSVALYKADKSFIERINLATANGIMNITNTECSYVRINGDIVGIDQFMLELGSTATAYEPYQGQEFEINLGNYFTSEMEQGSISDSDGSPTSSTARLRTKDFISVEPSTEYTLVHDAPTSGTIDKFIFLYDESQTFVERIPGNWTSDNPYVFTTTATAKYIKVVFKTTPETIMSATSVTGIMLYPTAEPPIELAKIGTYQDRIYKDAETSKWYVEKKIGKVTYDGSQDFSASNANNMFFRNDSTFARTANNDTFGALLSNNFTATTYNNTLYANVDYGVAVAGGANRIAIRNKDCADKTAFLAWLTTHPTTVYYALSTPTTTEITDETLLSQLNFIASLYGGVNNISLIGTGAQGEMEVLIRDVLDVERDVVPETPVRLTLTDGGVINACGCRRDVQLTMRETTE